MAPCPGDRCRTPFTPAGSSRLYSPAWFTYGLSVPTAAVSRSTGSRRSTRPRVSAEEELPLPWPQSMLQFAE